jgi:hypothetical protein
MSQSRGAALACSLARASFAGLLTRRCLQAAHSARGAARVLLIFDGFVVEFPSVKWWSFKFLPTT